MTLEGALDDYLEHCRMPGCSRRIATTEGGIALLNVPATAALFEACHRCLDYPLRETEQADVGRRRAPTREHDVGDEDLVYPSASAEAPELRAAIGRVIQFRQRSRPPSSVRVVAELEPGIFLLRRVDDDR